MQILMLKAMESYLVTMAHCYVDNDQFTTTFGTKIVIAEQCSHKA